MALAKSQRLEVRINSAQRNLIRRAAEAQHKSISDFILDSACRAAENTLYDLRILLLDTAAWEQLRHEDERLAEAKPEVVALFSEKAPWD